MTFIQTAKIVKYQNGQKSVKLSECGPNLQKLLTKKVTIIAAGVEK